MTTRISDDDFIRCFKKLRSPALVAEATGLTVRGVYRRRKALEKRYDLDLASITIDPKKNTVDHLTLSREELRATARVTDGVVIVFSDAHYWPDLVSVAHLALVKLCKTLKPKMVIGNGDLFDGARISSHPRIGWAQTPSVQQELHAVLERTAEIEKAAKGAHFVRTIGNHDIRFERRLSNMAPEYEGIAGFALKDHLPGWSECWSLMINGHTMVKHRFNNGMHAAYNNTLRAGTNIVTGHLHRLIVTPWGDYNGRRYGVDTGTLAEPDGPQFTYGEDNPSPHCSGFAVLTFDQEGRLLPPELCEVIGGRAYFRGQVVIDGTTQ